MLKEGVQVKFGVLVPRVHCIVMKRSKVNTFCDVWNIIASFYKTLLK